MKTENNLENKAKFFALYFMQDIVQWDTDIRQNRPMKNSMYIFTMMAKNWFLQLKPLKSISDGEIEYCNSLNSSSFKYFNQEQVDYLRSKGYALPFMNLSVQDLIDYGWIKLVK